MDARINRNGYSGKHAVIVSSRLTIHIQCRDTYNVIDKIKQQSGWPTWTNEHGAGFEDKNNPVWEAYKKICILLSEAQSFIFLLII